MWFLLDNPLVLVLVLLLIGLLIYMVVLLKKESSLNTLLQNKQYAMRLEITKKVHFSKRMKLVMVSTITPVVVIALVLSVGLNMSKMDSDMVESGANLNSIEQIRNDFLSKMDGYVDPNSGQYYGYQDEVLDSSIDFVSAPESVYDDIDMNLDKMTIRSDSHASGNDDFDTIITDEQYIYSISESDVLITLAYTSTLQSDALQAYKELPQGDFIINGMYVDEDNLILIKSECGTPESTSICDSVEVMVYSKDADFQLIDRYTLSGNLIASKKIGNDLFVITNEMIPFDSSNMNLDDYLPFYNNGTTVTTAYNDIVYSEGTYPNSFTTIYGINIDSKDVDMEVLLSDDSYGFHISEKSIYLIGNAYLFESSSSTDLEIKTAITEVSMNENNVEYSGTGYVEGYALNKLAVQEYDNQLRIVTTTVSPYYQTTTNIVLWNKEIVNRLFVLDDDLSVISVLGNDTSIGAPGETASSATFIEDYAYISTFENTESLYVVDLSDETKPIIIGIMELLVNNDYVLPITNEFILGIDLYEASNNIKEIAINTYNSSDKLNPMYKDQYLLLDGTFGFDWSTANYDLNNLQVNINKGTIMLPYTVVRLDGSENITHSGILVFNIDTSLNIINSFNVSHETTIENDVVIKKSLYIKEYLYTVSDTYIKVSTIENPDVFINSLALNNE